MRTISDIINEMMNYILTTVVISALVLFMGVLVVIANSFVI